MKNFIWLIAALFLIPSCAGVSVKNDAQTNARPIVTFVFDDGNDTDYTIAKDVFKAQGAVACTAVVTDWVNTKNHLSLSQLKELQDAGWEIMSHTKSHPNLKSLTEEQIEAELSGSKAALEAWGFPAKNLVYPYNKNNELVRKVAEKYYRSARGGRSMLNSAPLDMYELKSYSLKGNFNNMKVAVLQTVAYENSAYSLEDSFYNANNAKRLVDKAYSENKWLIFYDHKIDAKIKVSCKNRDFIHGESLIFKPSGAGGKYIVNGVYPFSSAMRFVPISGIPRANDTVTGLDSGAVCNLDKVYYNDRENITELINYIHTKYSDMEIVTIDKGLDIAGNYGG